MIAPARQAPTASRPKHAALTIARRAVARSLLAPVTRASSPLSQGSVWLAWILTAAAVACSVFWFAYSAWWAIEAY